MILGIGLINPQTLTENIRKYAPTVDEQLIHKAYVFALDYHGTQLRDSGTPFFMHPLEVAKMLVDLKMDVYTVVAGLLHDTVEDTPATISQIEAEFGSEIAKIVNGVTKLSKFEMSSIATKQTENFKKLLISAASDIRVLIIKLVDRLHNMRTLKYRPKHKRQKTAKETLEIYAPLAERIGISSIKNELQDIAFMELYPDMYTSITTRLKKLYEQSAPVIDTISAKLNELSETMDIKSLITGRLKTPYSIWQKMNTRNISFDQLSDIMAFRIIVDTIPQCYQMLGAIHRNYLVVPGRFRDYISTPKNNGYQSLHTSVIGPLNKRIEIQIRTKDMHQVSEYGVAAHWNYKQSGSIRHTKHENYQWLRNLVEILENTSGIDEFIESSKNEMFAEQIFCLTPKGKIISLPKGSTALDFAYSIHSEVGNHAVSAKINGLTLPLKTVLSNGDQVEIEVDPNCAHNYLWENYVVTIKAKSEIRKVLNGVYNEKLILIGKSNIEEFFKHHNIKLSDTDYLNIIQELKYKSTDQLFAAVGTSECTLRDIIGAYNKLYSTNLIEVNTDKKSLNKESYPISGIPKNLPIIPVSCCTPIPGDRIVGVLLRNIGIEIHLESCKLVHSSINNNLAKVTELYWNKTAFEGHTKFLSRLSITISYAPGNLSKMANVIESKEANIINLKIGEKFEKFTIVILEIEVQDITHLSAVTAAIRDCSFVTKIERC